LERDVDFHTVPEGVYGEAMRAIMDAPDMEGLVICGWCMNKELETDPEERAERLAWLKNCLLEDARVLEERHGIVLVDHAVDNENARLVFEVGADRELNFVTVPDLKKGERRVLEGPFLELATQGRGLWMWRDAKKVE
jgi:hypothetical protein